MSYRRPMLAVLTGVAALTLLACQPAPSEEPEAAGEALAPDASSTDNASGVVEITVEDFAFVAPPSFPSGWNTLRMTNTGEQPHFLMLVKLPEGVEFSQYAEFSAMFQQQYDRYASGEATQEEMLGGVAAGVPDWFGAARAMGGVALTSPGFTAETTVRLEPGNYVMECYVVTPEGRFHGSEGMLRPLIVTEEDSGIEPPQADVIVTLSNYVMAVEGELTAGQHVVRVDATESAEGFTAHDVNVARLDADTSLDDVIAWMSWIDGLRAPAPATFLGGADHLEGGATAYFRLDLQPGRYAFVSEGFATRGMVHEFEVE
jgi:hypothetical protein